MAMQFILFRYLKINIIILKKYIIKSYYIEALINFVFIEKSDL